MSKSNIKSGYSFKCAEKSCKEIKNEKESISFFGFPKDPARLTIWLVNCKLTGDTVSKNFKLCGKHFEKKMFLNDLQNRLQLHAIPTLFPDRRKDSTESVSFSKISTSTITESYNSNAILAHPLPASPEMCTGVDEERTLETYTSYYNDNSIDVSSPSSSKSCQTLKLSSAKTPRKMLLCAKLKQEKETCIIAGKTFSSLSNQLAEYGTVDNFFSLYKKHLAPSELTIVNSYMMTKTKTSHGLRYSNDMKQLALTIYFLGPAAYRFLKTTLCIPSVNTLRSVTRKYKLFQD